MADYDEDPHQITVTPDRLEKQFAWMRARGLRGVGAAELMEAQENGSHSGLVGLTFDDGYVDFIDVAIPILQHFGFTASVYVVADLIGGENVWDHPGPVKPLMTADQIATVVACGMEVGSHSCTHQHLPSLSDSDLTDEIERSREQIVALTGAPVQGFVYPYGDVGPREAQAVHRSGYDYACAIWPSASAGRYALPRTFIGDRDSSLRLAVKRRRHSWRRYVTDAPVTAAR
ncbi:polysaccharide deacetylase family protein [Pseudonocardia oceani]|uniref:polysaccharide deacetylase family protein n=1 Tax=Pseudonocardia oceani TaxID=2792013 RepID=UPI001CF6CDC1|nr:polysaccharide deacetylase family protein [Pseudonocardia oceani]